MPEILLFREEIWEGSIPEGPTGSCSVTLMQGWVAKLRLVRVGAVSSFAFLGKDGSLGLSFSHLLLNTYWMLSAVLGGDTANDQSQQ